MQLVVGNELQGGKYRIEQELGSGGFGTTYRAVEVIATRPRLETRTVVVKEYLPRAIVQRAPGSSRLIISPDKQASFDMGLGKFVREGRILLEIAHPNIVRVYQVFEENETAYLVMEHLPGGSLEVLLQQAGGQIGEKRARQVMEGLVAALDTLHRHNPPILHLDIKPQNVMFRADGTPVLIDFGAARQDEYHTQTHHAFTLNFAPPELMSHQSRPGPESDLYEMGVLLHLLLVGQLPPNAMERASQGEWTPQGIPEPWHHLIRDALILHQDKRPKDIRAWWHQSLSQTRPVTTTRPSAKPEVDPALTTQLLEPPQESEKRDRGFKWAGVVFFGAAALAGIGFVLTNPSPGPSVAVSPPAVSSSPRSPHGAEPVLEELGGVQSLPRNFETDKSYTLSLKYTDARNGDSIRARDALLLDNGPGGNVSIPARSITGNPQSGAIITWEVNKLAPGVHSARFFVKNEIESTASYPKESEPKYEFMVRSLSTGIITIGLGTLFWLFIAAGLGTLFRNLVTQKRP